MMGTFMAIALAAAGVACGRPAPAPKECAPALEGGRGALESLVNAAQVLDPNRHAVHLAHVCSLTLNSTTYPVVDLQELVKSATTARGVNSILIFGPDRKLRRRLEYTTERPLLCAGAKLYVWGDLSIEGIQGEGNELQVSDDGRGVSLRHVDPNDLPL